MKKRFLLYACCLPVKGYKRSIIVDVQRQNVHFIPNTMFSILKELSTKDVNIVKKEYCNSEVIDDYITFLESKELGYFSDTPNAFPSIALDYESPYLLTNAIIVINEQSKHDYNNIFSSLEEVSCQAIELRILYEMPWKEIKSILDLLNELHLSFRSITLIFPYLTNLKKDIIDIMLSAYPQVNNVIIYNSPIKYERKIDRMRISLTTEKQIKCGNISIKHFSPNLKMFVESKSRNNCLNQKVCIDYDGSIKNCPAMEQIYGNVLTDKLIDVVKLDSFTKMWTLIKDDIMVCKDCEFRYICPDCRAFLGSNIYSCPLKCHYNPYVAKWEGEDGYIPTNSCINKDRKHV